MGTRKVPTRSRTRSGPDPTRRKPMPQDDLPPRLAGTARVAAVARVRMAETASACHAGEPVTRGRHRRLRIRPGARHFHGPGIGRMTYCSCRFLAVR